MIHRRAAATIAGAAAVLALAGCTAAPAAPDGTSHVPSPSPTITRTAAAPSPRIPITCPKLLATDELQAQLIDPIAVRDDGTAPHDFAAAVLAQTGGLTCAWGGEGRTDSAYDTGLSLTVLPDAAADFAAFQKDPYLGDGNAPSVGAASIIHCNGVQAPCLGDVLAGSTWLEFTYSDAKRAADPTSAVVALLTRIANRVQELTPAPAWTPPSSAVTALECTDASGTALIGVPVSVQPDASDAVSLASVAARRAGVAGCEWGAGDRAASGAVGLLPGGAWAFAPMAATSPTIPSVGPLAPSAVAGTDGAMSACGDGCDGIISTRGSLIFVNADGMDPSSFLAAFSRVSSVIGG